MIYELYKGDSKMKIVNQSWVWLDKLPPIGMDLLRNIEAAGRTCYKSEDKITNSSAVAFVARMLKSGHHAMIEHAVLPSVRVITDRGVTHEIVRHRLFSYAQESTRYCNYAKGKFRSELTVILPVWFRQEAILTEYGNRNSLQNQYLLWEKACEEIERFYMKLISAGQTAQEARSVLPNSLKTEIIITGNAREWRHFFTLRCSKAAHPQMRNLAKDIITGFREDIPLLFDDII